MTIRLSLVQLKQSLNSVSQHSGFGGSIQEIIVESNMDVPFVAFLVGANRL